MTYEHNGYALWQPIRSRDCMIFDKDTGGWLALMREYGKVTTKRKAIEIIEEYLRSRRRQ